MKNNYTTMVVFKYEEYDKRVYFLYILIVFSIYSRWLYVCCNFKFINSSALNLIDRMSV